MPRRQLVVLASLLFAACAFADDQAIWREYGLVEAKTSGEGAHAVTTYHMKDLTGALAAWQWQRSPASHPCTIAPFCAQDAGRTLISDDNYLIAFTGKPTKAAADTTVKALADRRGTSLPAILTFIPHEGLVPNSTRYVLGPDSLHAFAPELSGVKPGFDQGAEAQVAQYQIGKDGAPLRLALFYYPSPEMARMHIAEFQELPGAHVKRSRFLVALVFGAATGAQADTLLSRIEYEGRITWNDEPPANPIPQVYSLLMNIAIFSIFGAVLCLTAGLLYGGMRLYRRRFGTLESDEALTTLRLTD